jgi:hypothetical protein
MSINIIKRADNTTIAVVVNRKKCYVDIDTTTYNETMILAKKGLKIITVEDLHKKIKSLNK